MNRLRIHATAWRALALAAVVAGVIPATAAAEPTTCPSTRSDSAKVTIASPRSDTDVSGRVEVTGRVEAPTPMFQVELFVGDARRDLAYFDPPSAAVDFTLTWDAAAARSGPSTLRVVACGGSPDGLSLIRGAATVAVTVQSTPPTSGTKALVDAKSHDSETHKASLVMGIVIAVPAAAGLFYAASGRRRRM